MRQRRKQGRDSANTCGSGGIRAAGSPEAKMLCRSKTTRLVANGASLDVGVQKALQLKCTVWAGFTEDALPVASTSLEVAHSADWHTLSG